MFLEALESNSLSVQKHIDNYISQWNDSILIDAMRYALNGGKRLRAYLVVKSASLFDIPFEQSVWPACGIEAIHAYSLVHDDLPSMDNDDVRRGKQTVHRKWDEATAILTGDALQSLGFEFVLNEACSPDAFVRAKLALKLSQAAGGQGMVLGQAMDIAAEKSANPLSLVQITKLQREKTGALIAWSSLAGAILAKEDAINLNLYANSIGLAFQIADDIIDVEGDSKLAGKKLKKDKKAGKATFVSLLGLENAKSEAKRLVEQACDSISTFGVVSEDLKRCAQFIISRDR